MLKTPEQSPAEEVGFGALWRFKNRQFCPQNTVYLPQFCTTVNFVGYYGRNRSREPKPGQMGLSPPPENVTTLTCEMQNFFI